MKRAFSILLAAVLCLSALAGCAGEAPEPSEAPSPAAVPEAQPSPGPDPADTAFTFTDALGRAVTVSEPRRVAALLGSFCQTWCLAGGADTVCAAAHDAWEDFDLGLPADAVDLGSSQKLSLELLLSAAPDLVLASTNTASQVEWLDTLEKAGIAVAYFDVTGFQDYLEMLEICTAITGRADLFRQNGAAVRERVDAAVERGRTRPADREAPTVLSLRASASFIRAKNSRDNVLGEMLAALGCVNIADADGALLEDLSMERILEADPDYIFFVQAGNDDGGTRENIDRFIGEHPAWGQLTAVKEGRVYHLDKALYNLKPNDRWGEAYEKLEDILEGA